MVRIRLRRTGTKNDPHFRIAVADIRSPRDGRFIEQIGHYHPRQKEGTKFVIQLDRVDYWLKNGAQPTERVAKMIAIARKEAGTAVAA